MAKMKKPDKCCDMGSYEHQVPMPLKGRRQEIDLCIADLVAALNAANITTEASCCGHGRMDGDIRLEDGRILKVIFEGQTGDNEGRMIAQARDEFFVKKSRLLETAASGQYLKNRLEEAFIAGWDACRSLT